MKHWSIFAAALLLSACGVSDEDKLSGDMAGAEGTAPIEDAVLNGAIEADPQAVNTTEAPSPVPAAPPSDEPDTDARAQSTAPSFDCTNAWRQVERDICDDPALAALDRTMSARYFRALKAADPAQASLLHQSGAAFIRSRNRCPDPDCVVEAYQERIAQIAYIMGGGR